MATKRSAWLTSPAAAIATLVGINAQMPAQAQSYGPDTCIQGYVWREARPGDTVCVTPDVRARTAEENANAEQNREPGGGAYGPGTCKQGFVWREAFDGDTVCVAPSVRDQARADNAAAQSRKQATQPKPTPTRPNAGTVVFEVFGPGVAETIDIDPSASRAYDAPLPWSRTITVPPDVFLLQVVAVGKDAAGPGCRITLDGRVVAEQPVGGSAHCMYTRP